MTRTVVVVTAGLSEPSTTGMLGARLAEATTAALQARGEQVAVESVDLRPLAHPLADHLLTGFASAPLAAAQDVVHRADAVVAVTPVFSASYSGLFKMFFDVLDPDALVGVTVLLAATGGSARHSLVLEHALRPLFSYLRAPTVPTGVFAATEDWGASSAGGSAGTLADRIDRAAAELAELVLARPARASSDSTAVSAALTSVDFETLLGR